MKVSRRIRRSRRLIVSGIRLVAACIVVIVIALFLKITWLVETATIVAILMVIFTLFEYWSVRRARLKRR